MGITLSTNQQNLLNRIIKETKAAGWKAFTPDEKVYAYLAINKQLNSCEKFGIFNEDSIEVFKLVFFKTMGEDCCKFLDQVNAKVGA